MKERLSIRLASEDRKELERRASLSGKSLSEYTSEMIHESLNGAVRTDLILGEIKEDLVQLEGMVSIMQAYNSAVYAVLFGRTARTFNSFDEKKEAARIRDLAKEDLETLLSDAVKDVLDGENVWGSIMVENKDKA